jgi:peroxiredoxin Q/BCP
MLSWLFSAPLPPGTPAPDFELRDDSGALVRLSDLRGRHVVLVFYPGDNTPGCTKQLCEFRDSWEAVRKHEALVFGVNPQGAEKHGRFRSKHGFPFPLLVDEGQKVAGLYRAGGLIVRRTVYRIGPDGLIKYARRGAPKPDEVLAGA